MTIRYSVDDANVAWRVTDDEAIVLHADSSAYFGLNQSGTILWVHLTERPATIEQLSAWATQRFTGTPATLRSELVTFIDQLQEGRLVLAEDDPDAVVPATDGMRVDATKALPWEAPLAECFGELEKLILSGE